MIYEKYTGRETYVSLTEEAYTHIGPKAFLSCKSIENLHLPQCLTNVGDWAFAHMHNLTDLYLPDNPITFGKQVFLDCENLQRIHITPDTSGNKGLPWMLGASVAILENMNLLQPHLAGCHDTHAAWLETFDASVEDFITNADEHEFEPVFYGWFNDEDIDSTQLPGYLYKRRSQKLYLSYLRLRYPLHLSASLKKLLQAYLANHMPGGPEADKHIITWDLLPQYCRDDVIYVQLLEQAGALTASNIPSIIEHLPDASPEVIAYLLKLQATYQSDDDFFEHFSL